MKIFAGGQTDIALQTVSDLSLACPDFEINEMFLTCLRKQFIAMSSLTVYNYAKKWIDFLLQNTSGIRFGILKFWTYFYRSNFLKI